RPMHPSLPWTHLTVRLKLQPARPPAASRPPATSPAGVREQTVTRKGRHYRPPLRNRQAPILRAMLVCVGARWWLRFPLPVLQGEAPGTRSTRERPRRSCKGHHHRRANTDCFCLRIGRSICHRREDFRDGTHCLSPTSEHPAIMVKAPFSFAAEAT